MGRKTRWLLAGVGGVVGLVGAAAIGGVAWLTSSGGERFVEERVERLLRGQLAEGEVTVGDLDLSLGGMTATDVVVDGAEHDGVIRVPTLRADWSLRSLLQRRVAISRLVLDGAEIEVPRRRDGALNLPQMASSGDSSSSGYLPAGWRVEVGEVVVRDASLGLPDDGVEVAQLTAVGPVTVVPEEVSTELAASWSQRAPELGGMTLLGSMQLGEADLVATAEVWRDGQGLRLDGTAADVLSDGEVSVRGTLAATTTRSALAGVLRAVEQSTALPEGLPTARVEATLVGPLTALQTEGVVHWVPKANLAVSAVRTALEADVEVDAPGGRGQGELRLPTLAALVPLGAPEGLRGAATVTGSVDASGEVIEVSAQARADQVALVDTLESFGVQADVELTVEDGAPHGAGSVAVADLRLIGTGTPPMRFATSADLSFHDDRVAVSLRADEHHEQPLSLVVDMTAWLDTMAMRASSVVVGTPLTSWESTRPWSWQVRGDGVDDLVADLRSEHGAIDLSAERLSATRQLGHATVHDLQLDALELSLARFTEVPEVEGLVNAEVRFSHGDGVRPDLVVEGAVAGLQVDERLAPLDVSVDGRIANDRVGADVQVAKPAGTELLTAQVSAPLADSELYLACEAGAELSVDLAPTPWTTLRDLSAEVPSIDSYGVEAGSVEAQLRASGDLCDPVTTLRATAEGRYDERPVTVELLLEDAPEADHTLRLTSGVMLEGDTRLLALGDLQHERLYDLLFADADWGQLLHGWHGEVKALGVPADLVSEDLEGRLYGEAIVKGEGLWLDGTSGAMKVVELAAADQVVDARAQWSTDSEGMARGQVAVDIHECDPLDLNASIDLFALQRPDTPVPFEVTVSDAELPLDALAALTDGQVLDAEGALSVAGTINGTLQAPRGDLRLTTRDSAFTLAENGVRYTDLSLDARVDGLRLVVEELTAGSRPRYGRYALERTGEDLRVEGTVALDQGAVRSDLSVRFDNLWVLSNSTGMAEVKGELEVVGAYPALEVVGDIEVEDGRFDLARHLFVPAASLRVDEQITFVDGTPERLRGLPEDDEAAVALVDAVDVDVDVELGRSVRLQATVPLAADAGALGSAADVSVDASLEGEVDVAIDDGEPEVRGEVETEGAVDLFTADFDIEHGSIRFSGDGLTNPNLNFTLVRSGGSYGTVRARVVGTPDDLQIVELSSDDYDDQADVMALLLFGRPLSELDASEGQTGGQLVQEALIAAAGSRVEDALGADLVDSVSYDSDDGLALGWSLGTAAFLTVAVDPAAEDDENLTEARLSWFVGRRAEAEVQTGDAGASEAWLRIEERF